VTIYLALALACTAIVEALAAGMNVRSKNLDCALKEFLAGKLRDDQAFLRAFYTHPLVLALKKESNGVPSYIPPQVVGQVVYALVTGDDSSVSLKDAVARLPGTVKDNRIKGLLTTLIVQVNEDADKFRKAVEVHFDAAMDRASGWVKRHQQTVAILVAFIFVASANVDTFDLANRLSTDTEFREKQVKLAEQLLAKYQPPHLASGTTAESIGAENRPAPPAAADVPALPPLVGSANAATATEANAVRDARANAREEAEQKFTTALHEIDGIKRNLQSGGIALGWDTWTWTFEWKPKAFQEIVFKLAGLLITMFAVALGAPFWFDVLQRFMQVRQTGVSPREKDTKEGPV
ncbi:MAG: hypothetical protein ABJA60_09910, partial [Nitrosospira sp.]